MGKDQVLEEDAMHTDDTVKNESESEGEALEETAEDLTKTSDTEQKEEENENEASEELEESEESEEPKDKKDELIDELNDRIKRQMAEFENFRKRTDKEKTQMYDMGAKMILEKILPVVDNFERGLSGVEEECEDPFIQGMQMVYKQMMTTLDEAGLKPIVAKGQTFDPEFHNAVMHEDDDQYGENEIIEELQKGYMYHDAVVRHSMVKVAN